MSELDFLEQAPTSLDEKALKTLSVKLGTLTTLREDIAKAKEVVKALEKEESRQSREEIPGFLLQFGINKVELSDGAKVSIKEDLALNLPKKDPVKRQKVMNFLIQQGGGGLIKDKLTVEDPSIAVMDQLDKEEIQYSRTQDVNTGSLKAFMRGVIGLKKNTPATMTVEEIPKELSLYVYRETIIK